MNTKLDSSSCLLPCSFALVVALWFTFALRAPGATFTNVNAALPIVWQGAGVWGDYDNDGRLDMLLTGYRSSNPISQIWRNTGTGFANATPAVAPGLTGVARGSIAWGDYDNDGRLDLLLTGESTSFISQVWRNTSNSFVNVTTTVAPGLPELLIGSVAWGDYDNDGRLDMLLTGANSDWDGVHLYTQLWRNTGNGFTNVTDTAAPGLLGVQSSSVAWGDYDNDGWLDFLLTGIRPVGANWTPLAQIWRNTGTNFTNVTATIAPGLPGVHSGSVAWGDYDNDGRLDFLLTGRTNEYSGPVAQIWHNTGTNFTNLTGMVAPGLPGVCFSSVGWGDYDNDGRLDFLLTGYTDTIDVSQVWRNTGSGFVNVTATAAPGLPGIEMGSIAWGDYDNDGRLDFLLTGVDTNGPLTQLWHNIGATANTLPAPPTGLVATATGSTLALRWNPSSDAQTPALGLSYNVRVGTTPGGSDIVSPHASPAGARRLPALGNAQQRLSFPLDLSRTGRFYWSVQAVDTAFVGSPFAPESSFRLWPVLGAESGLVPGDTNGDGVLAPAEFDAVARNYWGPTSRPYMTNLVTDGLGLFQLTLTNANAWNFSVEVSTDLTNWVPLGLAWPFLQFTDPAATNVSHRFYRLSWP